MLLKSREKVDGDTRRLTLLAALSLAAAAVFAAMLVSVEGAGAGSRTTVVLGKTVNPPPPACPDNCEVVGSTTGFQVRTAQQTLPYRLKFDGRVVAWAITLAEPTSMQRAGLNGIFGQPPEARLAVLKRVPSSDPPRYRLQRQSALRVLSPYLGQTVRFKLGKPLRVRKGNIVGLSVPTWAPAFANGLEMTDSWRASRQPGRCSGETNLRQGRPQQVVDSKRTYGCRYNTARLLFTATVVKDRPNN